MVFNGSPIFNREVGFGMRGIYVSCTLIAMS